MATFPITWPRNARRINSQRRRSLEQHAALSEALACHRGELPPVRKSLERRVPYPRAGLPAHVLWADIIHPR